MSQGSAKKINLSDPTHSHFLYDLTDVGDATSASNDLMQLSATTGLWEFVSRDEAFPWTTWNPTIVGYIENAATYRYVQIGKTVHCHIDINIQSVSASINITLPVNSHASYGAFNNNVGSTLLYDVSTATRYTGPVLMDATRVILPVTATSASYAKYTAASSTVPFTWASGDILAASWTYEAA